MADTETKATPKSRKGDDKVRVAHNHDEQVAITNEGIVLDNEREVAQQEEWLQRQQDLADDVENRAPFNVTLVDDEGETEYLQFDKLAAIEVYGRGGMGRYSVQEGDSILRVVFVQSARFGAGDASKDDQDRSDPDFETKGHLDPSRGHVDDDKGEIVGGAKDRK